MDVRGIGIDVVEVERIEQAIARWGDSFVRRIFTPDEANRAGHAHARGMRLAARFAAKEAVMKALGLGWRSMAWREIEIRNDPLGRPTVLLTGSAARVAAQQGVSAIHVTLTHTHELAMASALAVGSPT